MPRRSRDGIARSIVDGFTYIRSVTEKPPTTRDDRKRDGPTIATVSFRTGTRLAVTMGLFALAIAATVSWFDADLTPRSPADIVLTIPELVGFGAVAFVVTLAMAYQRVEVNANAMEFRYANLATLHRWRTVRADRVRQMQLCSAATRMNEMVDSALVSHQPDPDDAAIEVVRLLDGRFSPIRWKKHNSAVFVAVHDLIRSANPHADLSRALYSDS